jgi:DNA topoisomerase-1
VSFRDPSTLAGTLPPDQLKLYSLIYARTLASQMADATGSTATVRLQAETREDGPVVFQASGTVIDFPGFLAAYGDRGHAAKRKDDDSADVALPPMAEGDTLVAEDAQPAHHETQPPARYTEASLVRTLEAKEIGRPSTYASIISTIIDRGYVYERGRALIPSWLAFAVTNLLESNFPQYVDYEFTAQMENGLDQIASGKENGKDWLTAFYFGTGDGSVSNPSEAHEGLHQQVAQLGDIDARKINTIEIGDGLQVRVGRYGPYLEDTKQLDAEGKPKRATIPDTIAPDELTVERGHELIEKNAGGPRELGVDPATGGVVTVRTGRYGPYVALTLPQPADDSAKTDDSAATSSAASSGRKRATKKAAAPKPKMASLFKSMTPETVTLDQALQLLSLPRTVGQIEETDPATGELVGVPVLATNGRYGPYITKTSPDGSSDSRSLGSEDEIFTVTIDQAKALFAQPKTGRRTRGAAKPPLRELGTDPESGKPVTIKDGFYGVYITDGTTNRTLPKQYTAESITPEEAYHLLAEKRAAGPSKRGRRTTTRKSSASSKTTGAKKTTTRKTTAKKTTAKKTGTAKKTTTRRTATRKPADGGAAAE